MLAEAVLMAGTDTTRNQLACAVALLGAHPDQWRRLVADPSLAPGAVDETMRYLGGSRAPSGSRRRTSSTANVTFPRGTLLSLSLSAGNRDPEVFAIPEAVDIGRETAVPHLTFGSGIHYCLGGAPSAGELQEALALLGPDCRVSSWPGRWSGSRRTSASGDRRGCPCVGEPLARGPRPTTLSAS